MDCDYRAGVLCFGSLLVEPRAQMELTDYDEGPVLNYLRQTKIERALLINFGTPKLQIKRLIYSAAYRQQRENARMTDSLES